MFAHPFRSRYLHPNHHCCQFLQSNVWALLTSLTSKSESATASRSTISSARRPENRSLSESLKRSILKTSKGGWNSSVGSAWAHCPQRRGFNPPLGTFSGRGDFSLGANMDSNSIPPKTLSDESINRGLVCAHMHFIARTQKILTFMS